MRQDARHRTLLLRHPRARPADARDEAPRDADEAATPADPHDAADASQSAVADEQLAFVFHDQPHADDRPATLGRIGPPTLPAPLIDWHARGIESELMGDLHGAIECYGNALRTRGPDPQIVFDLAHALAEAGEPERAAERYRQAIELDPAHADAWNNLGDLLAEADDVDGAIDAFRHAIAAAPDDAAAHFNLADTLDRVGRDDEARQAFERFLSLADDADAVEVHFAIERLAELD